MTILAVLVVVGLLGAAAGAALVRPSTRADPTAPRLHRGRIRSLLLHHRHLAAVARRDVDPTVATGVALSAAATVLLATTALAGVVLALATSEPVHGRTDDPVADWAAAATTPAVADVARAVTLLGSTWTVVALAVVVAAVERRRRPAPGLVPFLALVVAGHLAVVHLAKVVIDRARPDVLQLTDTATASFPSGHAAAAAACYAAFSLVLGRGRAGRAHRWLAAAAGALAFTVAFSRVALGVHWTTDVVAGLVVGWGWFAACSLAVGGRSLRFGDPVAVAHDEAGGGEPVRR